MLCGRRGSRGSFKLIMGGFFSGIEKAGTGSKRQKYNQLVLLRYIVRQETLVSEKRPICGFFCRHIMDALRYFHGEEKFLGDSGRECERRPHVRRKSTLQLSKAAWS